MTLRRRAVIWLVPLQGGGRLGWRAGESLLRGQDRDRFDRLLVEEDRRRLAASRAVLAALVADRSGVADIPQVLHRPGRAPAVPGCGLHLSLSHAGDRIAAAVSDAPIGVDVEVRPASDVVVPHLIRSTHPSERRRIRQDEDLLRLWVRKEAVLKAAGGADLGGMASFRADLALIRHGRLHRLVDINAGTGHLAASALSPTCRVSVEWPV